MTPCDPKKADFSIFPKNRFSPKKKVDFFFVPQNDKISLFLSFLTGFRIFRTFFSRFSLDLKVKSHEKACFSMKNTDFHEKSSPPKKVSGPPPLQNLGEK